MKLWNGLIVAVMTVFSAPGLAVESMYLDTVPIKNPGEYLAPADFYLKVPPPTLPFLTARSLVPFTVYDSTVLKPYDAAGMMAGSNGQSSYAPRLEQDTNAPGGNLKVLIKAGLDHASDVPLAVIRDRFAEAANIELVGEGEVFDVLVEVEIMKLASSGTIFIVINAYKEVDEESLIFYNTFGYMGELKILSASESYAEKLENALKAEAERWQE